MRAYLFIIFYCLYTKLIVPEDNSEYSALPINTKMKYLKFLILCKGLMEITRRKSKLL